MDIIYEDNHLLVVNKPSGMLAQGDKTGDNSLVELGKNYLKKKYKKPGNVYLGLVHRLDRPVSGIVIMTKTSKALVRMSKQFQEKSITKIYWAITENPLPEVEDKLEHWLIKNHQKNIVSAYQNEKKGSVKAELEYKILSHIGSHYLTEIKLLTGRFHQIRTQFSSIGCPIVGDLKYGYKKPLPDKSICLHAKTLIFSHPVKNESMTLSAATPINTFWETFIH